MKMGSRKQRENKFERKLFKKSELMNDWKMKYKSSSWKTFYKFLAK